MATRRDDLQKAIETLRAHPDDAGAARALHDSTSADREGTRADLRAAFPLEPSEAPLDLGLAKGKTLSLHNVTMPAPFAVDVPRNRDDLRDTMARAAGDWRTMRGLGSGYSFSNIAFTEGHLLEVPPSVHRILPVDTSVLRTGGIETLISFEAGATIDELNKYLAPRFALHQQPAYEKLSYVGAMMVGGHGTGIRLGPIASFVKSIRLFTVDAQHRVVDLCIEPCQGITDPDRWRAAHPDVELIQDDRVFWSCVVSAGCFGVVHALTIGVRDNYRLHEVRTFEPWDQAKQALPGLLADPDPKLHSVAYYINPYTVGGVRHCIVSRLDYTTEAIGGRRGIGIVLGGTEPLVGIIDLIARLLPKAIPSLIDAALNLTKGDAVLAPPDALNQGSPNNIPVIASATGIDANQAVEAADAVFAMLAERANGPGFPHLGSPVALRFVKKTDAVLAPQYGRDTCMFETPCIRGVDGAEQTLIDIQTFLADRYGGLPHWGQRFTIDPATLPQRYPKLTDFLESFAILNPRGFFDNAFTEMLGLRRLANGA